MAENSKKNNGNIGLLARIDERTLSLLEKVQHIEESLDENYVTQKEFSPIKAIVYGMVAVILLSVIGGLVALVVNSTPHIAK